MHVRSYADPCLRVALFNLNSRPGFRAAVRAQIFQKRNSTRATVAGTLFRRSGCRRKRHDRRCLMSARPLLLAAAFIGGMVLDHDRALARTAFDGNWSVLIVTDAGQCDRAYRYGLVIRDGRVLYEGDAAVNVAGNVTGNGNVTVRVSAGSQHADGTGRLSSDNGSGKWSGVGSAGSCSGTWSAERR